MSRIYLSPPDVGPADRAALLRGFDGGWIAPLGPEVNAFEAELAKATDRGHAAALASGTSALHLALRLLDVGPGDRVLVQSLTFAATANAVTYVGAEPVFVDSEAGSWNMDPDLVAGELTRGGYAAVIPVDLYGQCCDYRRLGPVCAEYGVPVIEDAAEALGATLDGRPAGSFGVMASLSFNGNKIITTSGGGALVGDDPAMIARARSLASQAREPAPHYEHTEVGYNYRLSNLLAALGRSQLAGLRQRVERRRDHNRFYREVLGDLPGVAFMPEIDGGTSTFWLSVVTIDSAEAGVTRDDVCMHLESLDIEARPVWKPMHLQPVFSGARMVGGGVSDRLFDLGMCLPSGSSLTDHDRSRVASEFRRVFERA